MALVERDTFFVRFEWEDKKGEGTAQAFKFEDHELLVGVQFDVKRGKVAWIPARCCHCDVMLRLDDLDEVMKRDNVTLEDLSAIEGFMARYNKKKVESENPK